MTNREKNNEYDNQQVIKPKTEFYNFSEVDLALRRMIALNGFERDSEYYAELKEQYQ
jgi:hypothetical protein